MERKRGGLTIVEQHHCGGVFSNVASRAHGYTNVGSLQSWRVVDAVA